MFKILANLKSNHTRASFDKYLDILIENLDQEEVRIYPPFTAISDKKLPLNLTIGAQNFYPEYNGAFTGEICADMLNEFNIKSVLIGHYERRKLGEDSKFLAKKFEFAQKMEWEIIFCIGENEEIAKRDETNNFLKSQLDLIDLNYEKLIIAYEPIWAIGSGKNAQITDIQRIMTFIKTLSKADVCYGGSVNLQNIKDIQNISDGVLIGSASLDPFNLIKMIEKVYN